MNTADGVDLHAHSHCSDGALSPAQLVERAAGAGVRLLALTDHDTIEGLGEARTAALVHGIELVDGVEISAAWRAQTIHVLGLWIDAGDAALRAQLELQVQRRQRRLEDICARLNKVRLPGELLLQAVQRRRGVPTRTHLAAAMVEAGLVKSPQDAFHRYLGHGKPGYRSAPWPALGEVVDWIRAAGGQAVLAHPMRYRVSSGARRQLIADFAGHGGAALEVITGNASGQPVDTVADLAAKHALAGTVGSDFHDPNLPWNPLGRLAKLPARVRPLWDRAKN